MEGRGTLAFKKNQFKETNQEELKNFKNLGGKGAVM